MTEKKVALDYYTDVLCIWAYIGHRRVEELVSTFGNQLQINTHYCSVFSNALVKLEKNWAAYGGLRGYANHVQDVIQGFSHVEVGERVWHEVRPFSSAPAHLFLKSLEVIEGRENASAQTYFEKPSVKAAWELRKAFFVTEQDISEPKVHNKICETLSIDYQQITTPEIVASAAALLAQDMDLARAQEVKGSPTFIMDGGRQKLFGNVGFRVIEANVKELLNKGTVNDASWC